MLGKIRRSILLLCYLLFCFHNPVSRTDDLTLQGPGDLFVKLLQIFIWEYFMEHGDILLKPRACFRERLPLAL